MDHCNHANLVHGALKTDDLKMISLTLSGGHRVGFCSIKCEGLSMVI